MKKMLRTFICITKSIRNKKFQPTHPILTSVITIPQDLLNKKSTPTSYSDLCDKFTFVFLVGLWVVRNLSRILLPQAAFCVEFIPRRHSWTVFLRCARGQVTQARRTGVGSRVSGILAPPGMWARQRLGRSGEETNAAVCVPYVVIIHSLLHAPAPGEWVWGDSRARCSVVRAVRSWGG